MLYNEKLNYFYNFIKTNFIKGVYDTPKIPSSYDIFKKLKDYLIPGVYFDYPKINLNPNKTNIAEYNNNLLKIKFDFNIIFKSINNTIEEINNQFQNSIIERNKSLKELNILENEIQTLEANDIDHKNLKYYFSDSFNNSKFIDLKRSKNILLNTNDNSIKLDIKNAKKIDLSHYINKKGTYFVITSDTSNIISQNNVLNTRFDYMFTENKSDKWIYEIKTSDKIKLNGYFQLLLNKSGAKEKINKVILKFANLQDNNNTTNIYLEYKKDNEWVKLPETFKLLNKLDIELRFPIIETDSLKFNFIKSEPDDIENNIYYIAIQELNIVKSEQKFEGTLITKPITVNSYIDENFCIYSTLLKVNESLPKNTSIDYFVAVDDLVSGRVINTSYNVTNIDSPDAYRFVLNSSGNFVEGEEEDYSNYSSDLREFYYLSGAEAYEYWEPDWLPIEDIDKNTSKPNIQFFNTSTKYDNYQNISVTGDYSTGWFRHQRPNVSGVPAGSKDTLIPAKPDYFSNGKEFYKIFKWRKEDSPIISSIELKILNDIKYNNSKWIWNYDEKNVLRKIILNDKSIPSTDNLYMINDEGNNSKILINSVKNIRLTTNDTPLVENVDYRVHYYEDIRNSKTGIYNAVTLDFNDYIVNQEQITYQAGIVLDDDTFTRTTVRTINLEYEVELTESSMSSWNTYLNVEKNLQNPYLKLIQKNIREEPLVFSFELIDIDTGKQSKYDKENFNEEIKLNPGKYLLRIFTDSHTNKKDKNSNIKEAPRALMYKEPKWHPYYDSIVISSGINLSTRINSLDIIDPLTLINNTNEDTNKCAVLEDIDDSKYLIVKKPSVNNFPGYNMSKVFEGLKRYYYQYRGLHDKTLEKIVIKNDNHYIRNYYDTVSQSNITYTTGSSGILTYPSTEDSAIPDLTTVTSDGFVNKTSNNTLQNYWYRNISTYGSYIQVDNPWSSGYLFYESAENLQSYYSLSYRVPNNNNSKRIFLKAVLKSENNDLTPILDKYTLIINEDKNEI